ncbi:hypothetical protein ON010_g7164 [Phytophthora cinnamomi]|nr:hypothetical protein ON010_g7164 [Phytophthora cinnamomi]
MTDTVERLRFFGGCGAVQARGARAQLWQYGPTGAGRLHRQRFLETRVQGQVERARRGREEGEGGAADSARHHSSPRGGVRIYLFDTQRAQHCGAGGLVQDDGGGGVHPAPAGHAVVRIHAAGREARRLQLVDGPVDYEITGKTISDVGARGGLPASAERSSAIAGSYERLPPADARPNRKRLGHRSEEAADRNGDGRRD